MALSFLTKPFKALLKIFFPCTASSGDTPGLGAAETPEAQKLREWTEKLDAWLTPLKTDPNEREAFAFLQRLLRHNPQDPLDSVEVSAQAFMKTFSQSASAGDLPFLVELILETNTPSEIAHASVLIASLANLYGSEAPARVLPLLTERLAQRDQKRLATVLGTNLDTGETVAIPFEGRFQGTYCIGATGSGKTTVLLQMILSDIRLGRGVCLVEPSGDLVRAVIAGIPQERLADVIYLDITDSASAFGLNFYEVQPGADTTEVAKVASFVMHLFEAVWEVGPETPRLAQVLRNITRVLIENPGMTFAEIPLLLWDDGVREKLVRRVTNTQTKLFWSQYNKKAPRDREELIASTINKADTYLNDPLISRIVSQSTSTINVRQIMDKGKILLVNLSPQLIEPSRLIGALLLGRILMASFSRSDTAPEKRRPFMIFADEYQRFATNDFATFLAEARKSRTATTIAHQTLEQLSDLNRATALQAGTIIALRTSGSDSKDLASSFDTTPTQTVVVGQDPILAPVTDIVGHLVRRGHVNSQVQAFVSEYLQPLDALIRKMGQSQVPFIFGCMYYRGADAIEGQRLLNDCLFQAMQTGRADLFIHPQALLTLGGAVDDGITFLFSEHRKEEFIPKPDFIGLEASANFLGRPGLLDDPQAVAFLLKKFAQKRYWDSLTQSRIVTPGPSFLRMLRSLRGVLAILAREPVLVSTGQYQPRFQLRTYQDQENMVANELSQLPNYHAKVRLLTGEHRVRTSPAPPLRPEQEVDARIRSIKERMLRDGVTIPATAVEEAVRKRHEALRARPPGNGNNQGRPKQPPKLA